MARVLIAGCGDVGSALGRRLLADGDEVIGLRRDPRGLPSGFVPLAADLGDRRSLDAIAPGVERLCYTAAASGFDDDAYRLAYVEGLRNVLAALAGHPLERVVFVSSTGVYGQHDGGWVDEDSPCEPRGFSGQRLLEAEALVAAAPVTGVRVRFGGIYGPGRNRLIERVRDGAPCSEAPVRWTNRIHRDDCADVLRHLLALPSPEPVYVGVDREPAAQCEVMDWIAERLGVARPPRDGAASRRARGANKRCSSRRLVDSGYRFAYPTYREGYAAVLEDVGAAVHASTHGDTR